MRAKLITKRCFLTGVASTAAVAATAPRSTTPWEAEPAPPAGQTSSIPAATVFDAVIFNERYSDARLFAQTLKAQGLPVLPIAGDAGTLWYGTLRKRVLAGRSRLAGIGTATDLMILESLGREENLQLRFRARHDARGRKTLRHSIPGPGARVAYASLAAELMGPDWPARLAAALPRFAGALVTQSSSRFVTTEVERSADHPGMLVSWVLARRENT
jgi:hypothetical protein